MKTIARITLLSAAALLLGGASAHAQLIENFDSVAALPGGGWSLQNLSSPVGITNWFQGNDTVFPS